MTNGTPDSDPTVSKVDAEWEVLARYVTGEASAEEAEAVRQLLADRPGDVALLEALDQAVGRLAFRAPADLDVEAALRQVKARRDAPERDVSKADAPPVRPLVRPLVRPPATRAPARPAVRWRVPVPAIAAALILAIGIFFWRTMGGDGSGGAAATTIATSVGERDSLRLSDGTLVVLAPLTQVSIAAGYGNAHRTVELRGEAFFEVAHDDSHPFVVHAGRAAVRDIGTAFTVRESGSDSVIVVVTTGSVLMRAATTAADSGIVLHAGDLGTLGSDGRVVAQRRVADTASVSFVRGTLVFREATMGEVAEELHRWYGIRLRVADTALARRRLSATFTRETADQVLDVIRTALGAEFERKGDTVVVHAVREDARSR